MAVYPIDTKNTKNAITKYRVLEKFAGYSFVEFTLETGRTHQIRVHSLSMGCPVIGDPVYAKRSIPFNLSGQCLHAKVLGFRHPVTGKDLYFEAPLPEYFEKTLEILHRKYKING